MASLISIKQSSSKPHICTIAQQTVIELLDYSKDPLDYAQVDAMMRLVTLVGGSVLKNGLVYSLNPVSTREAFWRSIFVTSCCCNQIYMSLNAAAVNVIKAGICPSSSNGEKTWTSSSWSFLFWFHLFATSLVFFICFQVLCPRMNAKQTQEAFANFRRPVKQCDGMFLPEFLKQRQGGQWKPFVVLATLESALRKMCVQETEIRFGFASKRVPSNDIVHTSHPHKEAAANVLVVEATNVVVN